MDKEVLYKDLSYAVIGACMEVHRILGKGHSEVVYKDALEYEFKLAGIKYNREMSYKIHYKDFVLPRRYFADFVVEDLIILESKAIESLVNSHVRQTLNYLAISKLKLGLLVNFGEDSLTYRRIIL
jgi:GxxExxY protein